jgi:NAD(P)-dependent dehydrogenase (short-subunit alcohol dehydrogenase family)
MNDDLFSLHGRVALVTGASSGLGVQIARALARAGASIALSARRQERIEAEAVHLRSEGASAIAVPMDVCDVDAIDPALDTVERTLGQPPQVVVNCAGVIVVRAFLEQTAGDFDTVLDTNLRGAFFVSQRAALRMMPLRRGSIVNVASTAGVRPGAQLSSYSASKAALIHLTKVMAFELARYNIRANALAPGNFETDMHQALVEQGYDKALVKRIPQRRFGQAGDLDGAVLLLASDAGRYITGATIPVDGGHLAASL